MRTPVRKQGLADTAVHCLVISLNLISQDTQDEAHDGRIVSVIRFVFYEMASEHRNVKEMASEPRNNNVKTREMEAGASDRGGEGLPDGPTRTVMNLLHCLANHSGAPIAAARLWITGAD